MIKYLRFSYVLVLIALTTTLHGQEPDVNASPYFFIQTEGVQGEQFPLLSTDVYADVAGPVANVQVVQHYKNDGEVPIEAIYIFPLSTRAAVYSMEMYIGDRRIEAEIQEKKKARAQYQAAKSDGKRATLLEQHRTNVFQMSVANILPGDEIKVVMKYNEFLIPEDRKYTFVYPTVVGPRYVGSQSDDQVVEDFTANPYLESGEKSPYALNVSMQFNMPVPIHSAASPSHQVRFNYTSERTMTVDLQEEERWGGNRDFILEYQMAGESVGTGTLLYNHGDEQFFLTCIEPPVRISTDSILPREYIFVVDISGSMHGFPLEVSRHLMYDLITKLRPTDLFNVVLFAGSSRILSEKSLPATTENLAKAYEIIDQQVGGGGTELLPALRTAIKLPRGSENLSRSIVVVTDGYISVEQEVFYLIENNLGKSNLFAFGIGSGVNRELIEGMAHMGRGEALIITEPKHAHSAAERFRKYIQTPLLTNIQISFEGLDAYDVIPSNIPDLLAERPIYFFGKYRGEAKGKVKVRAFSAEGPYVKNMAIKSNDLDQNNAPIRYLWAREKIRWLHDFNHLVQSTEQVEEITNLGLKYHLLTQYTSFVAIDHQPVLAANAETMRVRQVLPMPQGVSNHAIGFEMGATGVSKSNNVNRKKVWAVVPNTKVDRNTYRLLEDELLDFLSRLETSQQVLFNNKSITLLVVNGKLSLSIQGFDRHTEFENLLSNRLQKIFQGGQDMAVSLKLMYI